MRLIDQFYKPEGIGRYTFVFDEGDPLTGLNPILALSEDGYICRQWTQGRYDPDGKNGHVGQRLSLQQLSGNVWDAFLWRLQHYRRVRSPLPAIRAVSKGR